MIKCDYCDTEILHMDNGNEEQRGMITDLLVGVGAELTAKGIMVGSAKLHKHCIKPFLDRKNKKATEQWKYRDFEILRWYAWQTKRHDFGLLPCEGLVPYLLGKQTGHREYGGIGRRL